MSWTHGYGGGMKPSYSKTTEGQPTRMDDYDAKKEEIISDVWDFSIAKAHDLAHSPEIKKDLLELVYSISHSILHNGKVSKMYHDSKGKGASNVE